MDAICNLKNLEKQRIWGHTWVYAFYTDVWVPTLTELLIRLTPAEKWELKKLDQLLTKEGYAPVILQQNPKGALVLACPRSDEYLMLDSDASEKHISCVLMQDQPDKVKIPLGYWFQTLEAVEQKSQHEKS